MTRDPWRASGLVSLLSDFGTSDPYVGAMKAVLWREARSLRAVVDLTHELPAHQGVSAASFFLSHTWGHFPAGTVHVAVVDPGVGTDRAILVVRSEGHAFLAPDNGLLDPILASDARAEVRAADVERLGLTRGSCTFHGRDRFAHLAAMLVDGSEPRTLGASHQFEPGRGELFPSPRITEGAVHGEVLLADRFGNLVTNVGPEHLPADGMRPWVRGREVPLVETYAKADDGELVCLVDSYGLFELAVPNASAAELLGAGPGTPVHFQRAG